ncbi:MAG TPA: glycerol-3-phosphate 1-O-acyltransferase PlsY [Verrucomicrobiae bacterium]
MPFYTYIVIAVGAYLLGSIPTGVLVARSKGIDIQKVGSGNIGATNVFRILGTGPGIVVLLVDALKGYIACAVLCPLVYNAIAPHYFGLYVPFHDEPMDVQMKYKVVAGICAILGHVFSCWLKFKGGKGVATSGGVFFALTWQATSIALAVWIILVAITRYVSVGSIAASVALPVATWFTSPVNNGFDHRRSWLLQSITIAAGLMVILKHRANIQRLRAGTEKRITFSKKGAAQ